jgi:hypothetical protein
MGEADVYGRSDGFEVEFGSVDAGTPVDDVADSVVGWFEGRWLESIRVQGVVTRPA